MIIIVSDFTSKGVRCAGRLYLPEGKGAPPVVVMAHGFAAQMDFRLPAFAGKFVERGIAAFVFDYRCFGESDGEPRNLVSPKRHLEDWKAAVAHVNGLADVDAKRLALWGSSFSGGHVLVTAAMTPGVSAVVSQVPFMDGLAVGMSMKPGYALTGMAHALRDGFAMLTRAKPHLVPVVSDPESFGLMNTPESMPGYLALVPPGSKWKNEAPARVIFETPFYRPVKYFSRISCPTLVLYADRDSLIPAASVVKSASLIPNAKVVAVSAGHFDIYAGELFERVSKIEADFLVEHLRPEG